MLVFDGGGSGTGQRVREGSEPPPPPRGCQEGARRCGDPLWDPLPLAGHHEGRLHSPFPFSPQQKGLRGGPAEALRPSGAERGRGPGGAGGAGRAAGPINAGRRRRRSGRALLGGGGRGLGAARGGERRGARRRKEGEERGGCQGGERGAVRAARGLAAVLPAAPSCGVCVWGGCCYFNSSGSKEFSGFIFFPHWAYKK